TGVSDVCSADLVYALFDIALDDDFMFILGVSDLLNNPVYFANNGFSFWITRFELLLNTRQTLCNIIASYTTGMERSHRQLRSWFTDGLSSDNTNRFAYFNFFTCSKVPAVALLAYTMFCIALEDRADGHFFNTCFHNLFSLVFCYDFIGSDDDFAGFRMCDFIKCRSADYSIKQRFD